MMKKVFIWMFIALPMVISAQSKADRDDDLYERLRNVQILPPSDTTFDIPMGDSDTLSVLVSEGDTLYFSRLLNVSISAPRLFASREDYIKYQRYRRYALIVYPYAKEAIRIFSEAKVVTKDMKKRKKKKYLKKLSKELKREFEDPLKGLSKTQGKILVEMIERELDSSMFDLIKFTQGKFKAFAWNQTSKLYGYRLKNQYKKGENPILDVVLQDFDVSYNHETSR